MSAARDRLAALADRWMGFWRSGRFEGWNEAHAEDFIDEGAAGRAQDREAFRLSFVELYRAFPEFCARTRALAVDETEGTVAIAWDAEARHDGPFMGEAASGARVRFRGVELIAIRDGRIVRRWGEWDSLDILAQIRAVRAVKP